MTDSSNLGLDTHKTDGISNRVTSHLHGQYARRYIQVSQRAVIHGDGLTSKKSYTRAIQKECYIQQGDSQGEVLYAQKSRMERSYAQRGVP